MIAKDKHVWNTSLHACDQSSVCLHTSPPRCKRKCTSTVAYPEQKTPWFRNHRPFCLCEQSAIRQVHHKSYPPAQCSSHTAASAPPASIGRWPAEDGVQSLAPHRPRCLCRCRSSCGETHPSWCWGSLYWRRPAVDNQESRSSVKPGLG